MKIHYFAPLALLVAGCARQSPPAVAVVPAPTATTLPTPQITVIVPPLIITTPTPDAQKQARRAVIVREIARLKNASPERDFEEALAKKDTRFIGVYGFTLTLPGVLEKRKFALINKYGVTSVRGTTDGPEFLEQMELNSVATTYATRYNQLLLEKLDEQSAVKTN